MATTRASTASTVDPTPPPDPERIVSDPDDPTAEPAPGPPPPDPERTVPEPVDAQR